MSQPPTGTRFEEFVALIARLRGPGGCPWDREQTHASLKPMTLEEAYEVARGDRQGRRAALAGELGDLLLQVVFHSQIATEDGRFQVTDVIEASPRRWCAGIPTCSAARRRTRRTRSCATGRR